MAIIPKNVEKLSEKLRKNGYAYKLVKRDDVRAIYEQMKRGRTYGFEVFKVRVKSCPDRHSDERKYYEGFPVNEDFGVSAWYYKTLADAEKRYENLEKAA